MFFGWFDARPAQAFGASLAQSFVASVPAGARLSDRKFETKAKSALKDLERQVAHFKREHRLNVYKKAKLGNSFKWTLRDAGYEAAYIDKLTDLLMLQLQ